MLLSNSKTAPSLFGVSHADALSESAFESLFDAASPDRKLRAAKFFRREDACRSVVAEALIRYAVHCATGSRTDDLRFTTNDHGKPSIVGLGLHFNVAHSGEWVICGIDDSEIGVDIERHHTIDSGIINRFFSQPEINLFKASMAGRDWLRLFFRIWSLKESYIKAIGKGLSCPLSSFACLPGRDDSIAFQRFDKALPDMRFSLVDIDPDYSCAVCSYHGGVITPVIISLERLISSLRIRALSRQHSSHPWNEVEN